MLFTIWYGSKIYFLLFNDCKLLLRKLQKKSPHGKIWCIPEDNTKMDFLDYVCMQINKILNIKGFCKVSIIILLF